MRKILSIILVFFILFATGTIVACDNKKVDDSNVDDTVIEEEIKEKITVRDAIILAQNDSTILNKIASRFGLVFYANPNWGMCEGEIYTGTGVKFGDDGTPFYKLILMGTISGYTDSYKSVVSYGNKFKIVAYVSIYGEVAPNISFLSTW